MKNIALFLVLVISSLFAVANLTHAAANAGGATVHTPNFDYTINFEVNDSYCSSTDNEKHIITTITAKNGKEYKIYCQEDIRGDILYTIENNNNRIKMNVARFLSFIIELGNV
jgi:hypothetical protein